MQIKHSKVSSISDGSNADLIRPSDWNAEHDITFRGALVKRTATYAVNNATWTAVPWDAEEYDTDTIHNNVTNNSRLTVPSGVTRVKLCGSSIWENNSTGIRVATFWKNASSFVGSPFPFVGAVSESGQQCNSPVLIVVAGDYFEMAVYQTSGGGLWLGGSYLNNLWFAMEIIK